MKKSKILLSVVAILVAAGSALAIGKAKAAFAGEPVYTVNGAFTQCYIDVPVNCGAPTTVETYYIRAGVRHNLPIGTQLKKPTL